MRKHFSIIFAVIIFAALSIFARPVRAQAMDSTEVALVLRDSKNAHEAARLALNTVACVLVAVKGEVDWTPLDCAERFNEVAAGLSEEHNLLHQQVTELLKEIPNRRRS